MRKQIKYASAVTNFYFDSSLKELSKLADIKTTFLITDDNVYKHHQSKLKKWKVFCIPAGEKYKNQQTVDKIITQLIEAGVDRKSTIVGIGGGVVTDIAGYIASVYMRGVSFGFVPTSILAMVDASIGGKNGIDVGVYKNMVGVIRQPAFLLYDYQLLKTLPHEEWVNGFAEILKHACIKDATMFKLLEKHSINYFKKNKEALSLLIQRNALLKAKVVKTDEWEQGDRKLLNFGHTLGHAIENTYQLPHGHAVTIGMVMAAFISQKILNFKQTDRIITLIKQYELTPFFEFDAQDALNKMMADKKRINNTIYYILLEKIGKAVYRPLPIKDVQEIVTTLSR